MKNNYTNLSNLTLVINHLKLTINNSGHSQFPKIKMTAMRNKLSELQNLFVEEVISEEMHPLKELHNKVLEAKKTLQSNTDSKSVVVTANGPKLTSEILASDLNVSVNIEPATVTKLPNDVPESLAKELSIPKAVDPMLSARLASEKKLLVEKNKRKSIRK